MAIVIYKCDTCQRRIEIPQNKFGLEVTGQCIITDGCHGQLHQFDFLQDGVVGRLTPNVPGLTNFVPRKVLFTHTQSLSAQTWQIEHNLGSNPSVQTFIFVAEDEQEVLTEVTPESITIISPNELEIGFTSPQRGVAQLISRSSNTIDEIEAPAEDALRQITFSFELSVASLFSGSVLTLQAQFFSPTTLEPTALVTFEFDDTPGVDSPWQGTDRAFISGKLFTIRSTNVETLIEGSNIIEGSPFVFTSINGGSVEPNSVFVLLSNPPHDVFDRDLDMIIDISTTTAPNVPGFLTGVNELNAFQSIIEDIFPPIRIV